MLLTAARASSPRRDSVRCAMAEDEKSEDGVEALLRWLEAMAADAAIVGSALVRRMGQADDPVGAASRFAAELAEGLTRR